MKLKKYKDLTAESIFLLFLYLCVTLFCIISDSIYSPDTYSYLEAMPYRQLGYVIFLKGFSFVFGSYFDIAVVFTHTVFSLFSVHYFYNKVISIFNLNSIYKLIIIAILLFPFFPPLSIANNLCSEGLGYGLYLLFIALGLNLLFNDKRKHLNYYLIVYLGLISIRSQFIFSTLIFAGVFYLIHRKSILQSKHLFQILALCFIIVISSLTERTYHKLKDGFFKPTPLGFVSASTAPFYVSDAMNYKLIKQKDYRDILQISYDTLVKKNLLVKPSQSAKENYIFFHKNLPKMCNQTIHSVGIQYFRFQNTPKEFSKKQALSHAYFEIEAACKVFTTTLIKANFKKWFQLFYNNITYGFYTPLLFFFVVIMFFFSLIKTVFNYQKKYAILFLLSSLILSNALFIAFASHSIMRYLFYNYALLFLLFINTLRILKREQ